MHGHKKWSCIITLLHPLFTSILGESLRWRGTTNITIKPRSEASKAQWYVLQHLHNVSNEMSLTISHRSSLWTFLSTHRVNLLECMKFETILCCVPLYGTMMHTCFTWGPLWFLGNDFPFSFGLVPMVLFTTAGVSTQVSLLWVSHHSWLIRTLLPSWVRC